MKMSNLRPDLGRVLKEVANHKFSCSVIRDYSRPRRAQETLGMHPWIRYLVLDREEPVARVPGI